MEADKTLGIAQFNGTAYQAGTLRMRLLLSEKKLWTVASQPKSETAAERVTWEPKDLQAQNLIVRCVADSQLPILHGKETSKEMWDALQTIYEPHSLVTRNFWRT